MTIVIHSYLWIAHRPVKEFLWFLSQVVGLIPRGVGGDIYLVYTWYIPLCLGWAYTGHIYRTLSVTTFYWFPQAPSRTGAHFYRSRKTIYQAHTWHILLLNMGDHYGILGRATCAGAYIAASIRKLRQLQIIFPFRSVYLYVSQWIR